MIAFITGGNGGIGKAIVNILKENNYKVFYPSSKELNLLYDKEIEEYLNKNIKDIDTFIHCAGINNPQEFEKLSDKNLEETLKINTYSCLKILKHILPIMKNKKYGRIVLISSIWSLFPKEGRIAYSMSKSSLDALTRGLAVEYGEYNILINSVLPGFIDTKLTRKNLSQEVLDKIIEKTPLRKLGQPEDIAKFVYFLGSKDNTFMTGQSIVVDGGYTLKV